MMSWKKWLLIFLLCLLTTFSATAQDSALFLYNQPIGMYGGQWPINGLFVYDEATGESRDLLNNPNFHVQQAAWSPDGAHIALIGGENREGPMLLYLMDADGGNLQLLTDIFAYMFVWSPDNQYIALTGYADNRVDLHIYDMATGLFRNLTNGEDSTDVAPTWSPDSQRIAFASWFEPAGIHILSLNGELQTIPIDRVTVKPVWSPDGDYLAYSAQVVNEPGVDLFLIDLDSGEQRQVASNFSNSDRPTWSPDGSQLAFIAWEEWAESQLLVMDMPRGEPYTPLESPPGDGSLPNTITAPVWSPDGESIAFIYLGGDASGIYVTRDGVTQLLISGGGIHPYGWQPRKDIA